MTTKSMELLDSPLPFKANSGRAIKNKIGDNVMDKFSSGHIIWYLAKRHKFGLVATWAVVITVLWAFPPLPDILLSLIGR